MKETGFFAEFKKFITRGNVLDMAVGVIIGGAFTAIVNSLVKDILNPIIGIFLGGLDLSEAKIVLSAATETKPESAIMLGSFISAIINFLLVALVLFIIIRVINRYNERKEAVKARLAATKEEAVVEEAPAEAPVAAVEEAAPVKSDEVALLEEIRDLLKKKDE